MDAHGLWPPGAKRRQKRKLASGKTPQLSICPRKMKAADVQETGASVWLRTSKRFSKAKAADDQQPFGLKCRPVQKVAVVLSTLAAQRRKRKSDQSVKWARAAERRR